MTTDQGLERSREDIYRPRHVVDLTLTVRPIFSGAGDPTFVSMSDGFWRAVLTPEGPATLHVQAGSGADRGAFRIRTWGEGAEWARASVPDLLGERDDWTGINLSAHQRLAEIRRSLPGLRLTRTGLVFPALVAAVFGQKTTGRQARAAWHNLVSRYGTSAPGPVPQGLLVAPSADQWSRIPSWAWHRAGVEPARSRVVMLASRLAGSIDRLAAFDAGDERIETGLCSIPGVGKWTVAETTQRSHGDPDSVSIGDYHLSKDVGWALAGRPVDDDGMLELLEPWRGHRQQIVRLIEASGYHKPRLGPRITIQDHRTH